MVGSNTKEVELREQHYRHGYHAGWLDGYRAATPRACLLVQWWRRLMNGGA